MYLHENKALFRKTIQNVSDNLNILDAVVEKDCTNRTKNRTNY